MRTMTCSYIQVPRPLPAWSGCTAFSPISPVRLAASMVNVTEADDLLADRDDQHVVAGSGGADVVQELCLVVVSSGEGDVGDLRAEDLAPRPEHWLERSLANGLQRRKVAGLERPDARCRCRHARRSLSSGRDRKAVANGPGAGLRCRSATMRHATSVFKYSFLHTDTITHHDGSD